MSLTEKWERFKAEQKDPTLVVTDDAPVIRESQTTETKPSHIRPAIEKRVNQLFQAVESMASQMMADNISYSVRHHLMQARLAEAKHILKLLGQDNADQNT
jgi:hypothetical protein